MSRPRMRRTAPLLSTVAVMSLVLSGCGKAGPTLQDQLTASIAQAQQQPHRFSLLLSTANHRYAVTGLVEDDFRYQASVRIDDRPSWEEVASDDTLADRFLDPSALPMFLRPAGSGAKASLPNVNGELSAGRWVIDDVGAPDPLSGAATGAADTGHARLFGQDPILDGVSALAYVRQVVATQSFKAFNKDALDYDPAQDPFPKPTISGPLLRYDSIRTDLPTAAQIQGFGGRATFPDITNFRRMSIYVDRRGAVVRVLENIDVGSRLSDLLSNAGLKLPRGLGKAAAVAAVVDSLNKLRVAQGDDPIDVHELDLTLSEGGDLHVTLPTVASKGSLGLLIGRGKAASVQGAGAA